MTYRPFIITVEAFDDQVNNQFDCACLASLAAFHRGPRFAVASHGIPRSGATDAAAIAGKPT